jgi:pimeloyl-ACP methyl ester carboxylesterase
MNKKTVKAIGSTINFVSHFSSYCAAYLAIYLFSRPQKGKPKKSELAFLDTSIKEAVIYQNISIMTYRWKGTKDTVLLVHGWESNASRWKDLIKILKSNDYNIIALDAPAHGNSGSKLFNALMYSECIHAVAQKFNSNIIIGHSIGGTASIFAQKKYQIPSIQKLVLLGAPADFIGVFNRYEKMMGYNNKVSNAMNQYVLKHHNHLPDYFSAANFSKEIKAKGLIIHDKKDRIIPFKDALNYKENYTNSVLISTRGFGHSLKHEDVYLHILEFLKT